MKKYLMCALILCAIPAVAAAQVEVNCESCTHEVSVYMGEGGFIATADDADMVTWVSTCDGVTVSGELEPNDDGVVMELFTMDNGLACMDEKGGTFQLGPITDGGWFWVTDDMNSAVGSLVAKDILKNEMTPITGAGEGVTMMAGKGAVYLKETATGRVGILPNILPEPPAPDAVICGPRRIDTSPYPFNDQMAMNCMLGDGRTKIRLVGPGAHNSRGMITTGMVTRPTSGLIEVNADLWVNESGSYSTDESVDGGPSPTSIQLGWPGKATNGRNWLNATYVVSLASDSAQSGSLAGAGVAFQDNTFQDVSGTTDFDESSLDDTADDGSGSSPAGQATIVITANNSYCPAKGTQHTATLNIAAIPAPAGNATLHPSVAVGEDAGFSQSDLSAVAALTQLRVVCAPRAASANQGTDLVPDNPFPPTSE